MSHALKLAVERFERTPHEEIEPATLEAMSEIHNALVEVAAVIIEKIPRSRQKSLALTALEEAGMRANRGLVQFGVRDPDNPGHALPPLGEAERV